MIGWTKNRKRCSKHGLVLRKRNAHDRQGDYCPACGERLMVVSVPYLFQMYIHPATIIVPCILLSSCVVFMSLDLDIKGCVSKSEQRNVLVKAQRKIEIQKKQEQREQMLFTMAPQWRTLHTGMESIHYRADKWAAMQKYFKDNPKIKLPKLKPEHLQLFLAMVSTSYQDNAFALITKHMQSKEEE